MTNYISFLFGLIYKRQLIILEQLGGSADDHFSAVFNVLDTSDADGLAQGAKHRLGFGLIYEVNIENILK